LITSYAQFGAEQIELGVAGGLAGVSRFAGSLIASTVYVAILNNVISSEVIKQVIPAVQAAGASAAQAQKIIAAIPLGPAALQAVTTVPAILEAVGASYTECLVVGVRTVALASLGFGGLGIIACLCLEDIDHKMNDKIEVYLENDRLADQNKFH